MSDFDIALVCTAHDFAKYWTRIREQRFQPIVEQRHCFDSLIMQPKALRDFGKVRATHAVVRIRTDRPLAEKVALPPANDGVNVVINHDQFDRKALVTNAFQFLKIHHD